MRLDRTGPSREATPARPGDDPTQNVLQIIESTVRRLDDMLEAAVTRMDDMRTADERRLNDLLDTKIAYLEKMNGQRDLHAIELREAESARIDAVRAIDVGAVQQASQVAATQAATLAAQVATSAETLRNQVSAAANAATIALSAALEPVQKDIADLRRAQYEAQGRTINVGETRESNGMKIGLIIAGAALLVTLLLGVIGIAITLVLRP